MVYRPTQFRHLLLQRIPFLDMVAVKAIVKQLPVLKTLGIHNCDLLTLSATASLIESVRDANIARTEQGNTTRLDIDFYPRYFQGPVTDSLGCYGAIHQDEGLFDLPRALGATLLHVVPLAADAGLDLITPGRAFRRWLDKIPFRLDTLPHILEAIMNLHAFRRGTFEELSGDRRLPAPLVCEMGLTLWFDVIVAVNGAPMREDELQRMVTSFSRDYPVLMGCRNCGQELPAYFYESELGARRADQRVCHGCQLLNYLDNIFWDMARRKRDVAAAIWKHGLVRDLSVLLDGGGANPSRRLNAARREARNLDNEIRANERDRPRLEGEIAELRARVAELPPFDELMELEEEIRHRKGQLATVMTRLGLAQWRGDDGTYVPTATASWQQRIAAYRAALDMESGRLQNNGPYGLSSRENFARDCNGYW